MGDAHDVPLRQRRRRRLPEYRYAAGLAPAAGGSRLRVLPAESCLDRQTGPRDTGVEEAAVVVGEAPSRLAPLGGVDGGCVPVRPGPLHAELRRGPCGKLQGPGAVNRSRGEWPAALARA